MIHNVCLFFDGYTSRIMPPSTSTKTATLLRLARKGPVRARDMGGVGIPRAYLKRLRDRGVLEQVDRGLYRLADPRCPSWGPWPM
jgi:hypothetical protein